MKTYTLIIWNFSTLLYEQDFVFKSKRDANLYSDGIFKGFAVCGKEPTGKVLTVKKEL